MERMYVVIMEPKSGNFYDLVFRGSFEEVYLQAKKQKKSRTDKIYEIKIIQPFQIYKI